MDNQTKNKETKTSAKKYTEVDKIKPQILPWVPIWISKTQD